MFDRSASSYGEIHLESKMILGSFPEKTAACSILLVWPYSRQLPSMEDRQAFLQNIFELIHRLFFSVRRDILFDIDVRMNLDEPRVICHR